MTSDSMPDRNSLPLEAHERIEGVCAEFEAEWKAGKGPRIEDFLGATSGAERSALFRELLLLELNYRRKLGENPSPDEYRKRFPNDHRLIESAFAADAKRRAASSAAEPAPAAPQLPDTTSLPPGASTGSLVSTLAEPRERARRIKCPHCGNRIQLVESAANEVTCESCGSSFSVDQAATATVRSQDLPKRIGKFEVLQLLGRGAFGAVYKARDPELDHVVAIKVPRAGYFSSHEEEERFLREARSAARLKHAAIVQVHAIEHDSSVPFIVSEFIDGLTLADVISGGRPTIRESAELLAEIADALDYAHREKVIHRDLKPANILIDHTGRPHVTDFGLARRDEGEITVTLDGQILGTPAYMSPEQAAGDQQRVDARSDVYSLGVILYELLTGELPFRGNVRMLLHQVQHDEPRAPRSLNDTIPLDLDTICLKAMAKDSRRRYPTARALSDDLQCWLNDEPIQARPVGKTVRLWRWSRRNPIVASLTAAVGTLLVAVSIASVIGRSKALELAMTKAGLADQEKVARHKVEVALQATRHQLALNYLQRGVALAEAGEQSTGLAWMLRGYETTTVGDPLRSSILSVMAGWSESLGICLRNESLVNTVAFSSDSKTIFTGCSDGTARLWDSMTGSRRSVALRHDGGVLDVAISRDGKTVLTKSSDKTVRLWDSVTGEPRGNPLRHEHDLLAAALSPDGHSVITFSDTVRVWDATTGTPRVVQLPHESPPSYAAISPDGKTVLTGSNDGIVWLWNSMTGEPHGKPLRLEYCVGKSAWTCPGSR